MFAFDPLACYEDLSSTYVREAVDFFNRELDDVIGEGVKRHYDVLIKYVEHPRVTSVALVEGGVVALYRGLRDEVKLVWNGGEKVILYRPPEDHIITWVKRVEGSERLVAINLSPRGSDEGKVLIFNVKSGETLYSLEGILSDFTLVGDTLVYVRTYRRSPPPDGGPTPTDRVVVLEGGSERILWGHGFIGGGESVSVKASPGLMRALVSVYRGWSRTRLYTLDFKSGVGELLEAGDYRADPVGWSGDKPVYIRFKPGADELVVGDSVFSLSKPVDKFAFSGDKLLLAETVGAKHRVKTLDIKTMEEGGLELPEAYYTVLDVDGYNGSFAILVTGFTVQYSVNLVEGDGRVKVVDEGVKAEGVRVSDIWVQSSDGVRVHGFLLSKGLSPRGVIIYGYGGFGISQTPRYLASFHHLLNMGYIIVVANLRGGREEGEEWHRMGMLKNKWNTFKDLEAFARLFKSMGLKVAAFGISNGGLTVGATVVKWPELFDAAIIGYPVLDMMRFHKLYVGKYWVPEYGDPEDPEMRDYMLTYSPYHNMRADKKMPSTLVYTGLHDDRVHPAHAIKFALKARMLGHPVYLRVETRSGHAGAPMAIAALEAAYISAFLEKFM